MIPPPLAKNAKMLTWISSIHLLLYSLNLGHKDASHKMPISNASSVPDQSEERAGLRVGRRTLPPGRT